MKTRIAQLLVVAALTGAVMAGASSASSTGWKTERYYARETSHSFADIGTRDNGGPGDVYVSQQTLTSLSGRHVGLVNGYGVNLHRPYVYFQYTGVTSRGTLDLEGAVNLKEPRQVFAISGGSGVYAGASGTVTSTDAGKKGALVVVRYHT